MIAKLLSWIGQTTQLWLMSKAVLCEESGIKVVDNCSHDSDLFQKVITEALRIIRESDEYRYRRVSTSLNWITNVPLGFRGARYVHRIRSCEIDFLDSAKRLKHNPNDFSLYSVYYASILVHEATHGKIDRIRKKPLSESNHLRTEEICKAEEHKFIDLVRSTFPDLPIPKIQPVNKDLYKTAYSTTYCGYHRKMFARLLNDWCK